MERQGWIKLHRQIIDSAPFMDKNPATLKVWMYCLVQANFGQTKVLRAGKEVTLEPGHFLYSRPAWSKTLKVPEGTLRNIMSRLVFWDSIEDMQKDSYRATIYKVKNWEMYQNEDSRQDSREDSDRTAGGQPEDTQKNVKKKKNDKNQSPPNPQGAEGTVLLEAWTAIVGTTLRTKLNDQAKAADRLRCGLGPQRVKELLMAVRILRADQYAPTNLKIGITNYVSMEKHIESLETYAASKVDQRTAQSVILDAR